jgi:hypothetical protein
MGTRRRLTIIHTPPLVPGTPQHPLNPRYAVEPRTKDTRRVPPTLLQGRSKSGRLATNSRLERGSRHVRMHARRDLRLNASQNPSATKGCLP